MNLNKLKVMNFNRDTLYLLFSTFLIALCGLLYELLIGSVASYLLGNSVKQFSFIIGSFMTAFGVGSFLSRYIKQKLLLIFIMVESLIGFLGSISVLSIYYFYSYDIHGFLIYFFVFSIGSLIGLEIPLIGRIVDEIKKSIRITLANLFSLDYIGAMIGSVAFPLFLLSEFGPLNTAFIVGLGNLIIALLLALHFRKKLPKISFILPAFLILFNIVFMFFSSKVENYLERRFYDDEIVFYKQSPYQKIVVTKSGNDIRLYLNGGIQFSSKDEYRYHESLIHVPLSAADFKKKINVLILGGGDGLAVRELLKYKNINHITVCDLDFEVTEIAKKNPFFIKLNKGAFLNKKVEVTNQDAFNFLLRDQKEKVFKKWDFIVIDLPDPNNESLLKLYSVKFYKMVQKALTDDGVAVVQSTSPYHALKVFLCIRKTILAAGLKTVLPYRVNVPAFGEWGFNLFSKRKVLKPTQLTLDLKSYRFLNNNLLKSIFIFPKDLQEVDVQPNRLFRPVILDYYDKSWKNY